MRKEINTIHRLTGVVLLAASLCAAQEIRTVVSDGVGSDPQSAAQDAAQNALTNVVGSFIDADKQLEKRTEIRNGIRSQTTQIRTDIKEYSQGSIQSFEIIETKNDGSLFRVTAKVAVRVAEFRAYVKKLAEGETAVGGGLFAEMTTTQKQSESLAKMLSERLLAVVNGEVIKFSVSKPVPFRRSRFAESANRGGGGNMGSLAGRFSPDQLAVFEVTATLDEAFLANLVKTLDSVAASKKRVSTSGADGQFGFWPMYSRSGNCQDPGSNTASASQKTITSAIRFGGVRAPSFGGGGRLTASDRQSSAEAPNAPGNGQQADSTFCLPMLDSNPGTATVYRFSNVDHELAQYLSWSFSGGGSFDVAGDLIRGTIRVPTLEVAVLDKDKKELQVELISGRGQGQRTALETENAWLLYCPVSRTTAGAVLLRQRTFGVVMKIEDDALRQADTIRVKLVK